MRVHFYVGQCDLYGQLRPAAGLAICACGTGHAASDVDGRDAGVHNASRSNSLFLTENRVWFPYQTHSTAMPRYRLASGGSIVVDSDPFDNGGEGEIYEINEAPGPAENASALVAKIYHDSYGDRERLRGKLKSMLRLGPPGPKGTSWFAWPEDLLLDTGGHLAGYVMPKIEGPTYYCLMRPKRRAHDQPDLGRDGIYVVALNLAHAIHMLHAEGHAVGDMRPVDLIVTPNGVSFVDCDSFQIRDCTRGKLYRCPVGRPEYTAPEHQRGSSRSRQQSAQKAADRFTLGILIFRLLMAGEHPFAGDYGRGRGNEIDRHIELGQWPYSKSTSPEPREGTMPLDLLPPLLQEEFRRCFVDGHSRPDRRPSARRWRTVIERARRRLQKCPNGHSYSSHLGRCPWCKGSSSNTGSLPDSPNSSGPTYNLLDFDGTSFFG